jgi:FixJ family two-component response regulator
MTAERYVLCVDDEPLLLEGLQRTLSDHFEVIGEARPLAALALLQKKERDFVAIVSDMRMPLMDGAKFLASAAELAPDSTRVLLTGHADLGAAIAAVNTGRVFRFLCKPCAPSELVSALEAAAEQHRLRRAEKDLLEQTLTGAVRLLSEVLALVAPGLFTRNQRIQSYVVYLAQRLGRPDAWRFELAACLSMIGCVGLPEEMLLRALAGAPLEPQESRALSEHFLSAHRLLAKIPRFEDIAEMVRLQADVAGLGDAPAPLPSDSAPSQPDASPPPGSPPSASAPPPPPDVALGARMLRVARAVEQLVARGSTEAEASARLSPDASAADRALFTLLGDYRSVAVVGELKHLRVNQMTAQMVLEHDVTTKTGVVVIPGGKQLTQPLLERLVRFSRANLLIEPIHVRVPPKAPEA